MPARPLGHWLLLLALVAMWGTSFLANKVAVAELSPLSVVAARMAIAGVVLVVVVVWLRRTMGRGRRRWLWFLVLAVVGNVAPFLLITWGQQRIDAGMAGMLMAVMPLMTLILAHRYVEGERLTGRRLAGFLTGLIGVAVLLGPDVELAAGDVSSALIAKLAVLAGALCYAANAILARHRPPGDALSAAAAVSLVAALLLAPATVAWGEPFATRLSPAAVASVLFLGLIATALATVVYFRIIAIAGPTFLSFINYLIPLWAVAAGAIVLGERPHPRSLLALALVLAGIAVAESRRRPPS